MAKRSTSQMAILTLILMILLGFIFGLIGYFVGQLNPLTGGPMVLLAEPGSPLRNQVAEQHAVIGAILGIVFALLIAAASRK